MKKLKLYIETSVWNYFFADELPDKKEQTLKLFKSVSSGEYEIFVSDVVIRELEDTPDNAKRLMMFSELHKYKPVEISSTEESIALAEQYLEKGIIPVRYRDDALHVAIAVVEDLDAVVSWNMAHIVRLKTKIEVNGLNKLNGYKEIEFCTPEEVMGDEIK